MKILYFFLLLCALAGKVYAQTKDEKAIRQVMQLQENAWNKGDLKGFMAGYWNSPDLLFIGSKGITSGWEPTLQNYEKSYPNLAAMGTLTFQIIKVDILSKDSAWVVGKWSLAREKDNPNGHFMLVWRKIKGKWYIIADHSS